MIPYGKQHITAEDVQAVVNVLQSDFITQGPAVPAFENALCALTHAHHAIAANSATSALHIACQALGLEEGDWLWTTPISFVASANCGLYCGANIDFVDIDPATYNLCSQALEKKLIAARNNNCLPKIVIPVHLCGQSCDMKAIHQLSKKYGFRIIEDASHGIGGRYQETPVGSCTYSDITVFSFHPVKIITTGEGGAALTNQLELAEKMRLLRNHGITRNQNELTNKPHGPWYYEQQVLGQNYRLTDLQAALGLSQLQRLHGIVSARHEKVARYNQLLVDLPVQTPQQRDDTYSAFHLYVIQLLEADRALVFEHLINAGIGVNVHYIPIYKQPYYQSLGFDHAYCPNAENYYNNAITLPLFPELTDEQQQFIVQELSKAIAL